MKPIRSNQLCEACYEPLKKNRLYLKYCSEACAEFEAKWMEKAMPPRKKLKLNRPRVVFKDFREVVAIRLPTVSPEEYVEMCRLSAERNM